MNFSGLIIRLDRISVQCTCMLNNISKENGEHRAVSPQQLSVAEAMSSKTNQRNILEQRI